MEVKLKSLNGRKAKGTRMMAAIIFQPTTPIPGIKSSKLSANSTTKATLAPRSSSVNSILTTTRADCPNETYARSANVINELSTSKHLARSFAVYCVVITAKR